MIIGRETDGTPIIFAIPGDGERIRSNYRKAKKRAERMPFENLEAFLKGIDEESRKPLNKVLYYLSLEFLHPDPVILAYRDVLRERRGEQ